MDRFCLRCKDKAVWGMSTFGEHSVVEWVCAPCLQYYFGDPSKEKLPIYLEWIGEGEEPAGKQQHPPKKKYCKDIYQEAMLEYCLTGLSLVLGILVLYGIAYLIDLITMG